jgi:hypothetical protein
MGVRCEVIAPSLIPKAPGDKARDRPSGLPAAGPAAPGRGTGGDPHPQRSGRSGPRFVPRPGRHGRRPDPRPASPEQVPAGPRPAWRGGNAWTLTHERWLGSQRFHQPALAATYAPYRAVRQGRDAQLEAIGADLAVWYDQAPFADAVHRLSAYPGRDPAGRVDAGQRGVRLAPVPQGGRVHRLLWLGAFGGFQRDVDVAGPHHQGWQRPPARPTGPGRPGP